MGFLNSKALMYLCSGCAATSIGLVFYAMRKRQNIFKNSTFFLSAVNTLETHPGASRLLGPPITVGRPKVVPTESTEPSSPAQFRASVEGSKTSGTMYFWAVRSGDVNNVTIDVTRIELELKGDRTKRLLVKS